MELKLDIQKLRNKSIFLATPMYGGICHGFYHKSMLDLQSICWQHGLKLQYFSLFNESLITRARNYCADEFMRSDCTHLMFIDSDIEFNPWDVIALLQLAEDDKHIIGGPYPKKNISWEKVKRAVDKGFADENPFILEHFGGDFVFNPAGDSPSIGLNAPAEMLEIGTGFMMIQRQAFEVWNSSRPDCLYNPDHIRAKHFDGTRQIMAYFQDPICPEQKRHLSEDYWFCQQSRKLGLKVWICPWMQVHHVGTYKFVGDLRAVAATGASATADPNEVKGAKK